MGCDIHLFAERSYSAGPCSAISDGQFWIPEDYNLFAALAGVRAEDGFAPLITPRGIPSDVSSDIADRYFFPVAGDSQAGAWHLGEHFSPREAKQHVEAGRSHWHTPDITCPLTNSVGPHVSHPDWHSASWLTLEEIRESLTHAGYPLKETPQEFQLFFDYLTAFADTIRTSIRIVFWFDN